MRASVQVAIFLLLTAAIAGGVFTLVRQPSPGSVEVLLPTPTPEPEIKVYINGAVRQPGVYQVDGGDRLADVVTLAGGLTEDADPTRVNLALLVKDEAHFYIPRPGEPLPTPSLGTARVNINTASAEELQTLYGIGEQKASDILEYRQQNGPFLRVEDLLKVNGIGSKTLEDLRELITVS